MGKNSNMLLTAVAMVVIVTIMVIVFRYRAIIDKELLSSLSSLTTALVACGMLLVASREIEKWKQERRLEVDDKISEDILSAVYLLTTRMRDAVSMLPLVVLPIGMVFKATNEPMSPSADDTHQSLDTEIDAYKNTGIELYKTLVRGKARWGDDFQPVIQELSTLLHVNYEFFVEYHSVIDEVEQEGDFSARRRIVEERDERWRRNLAAIDRFEKLSESFLRPKIIK